MLFSVLNGSGMQLLLMSIFMIFFAAVGFLSPANRGSLMIALLTLFALLAIVAGYVSARYYKMFGGENWQRNTLMTAFFCPGIMFTVFFVVNLFVWGNGSSAAVPFGSMF